MFGGNPGVHQLRPQLFKSGRILLALWLGLEQGDGTDVFSAILIFCRSDFFQPVPKGDCIHQHFGLTVPVIDDHRQLNHVLRLELHRVHIGDDVAALLGGGGQIQHKAGVEIGEHFNAQLRPGVMALVHNHQRVELVDNLKQCRLVRLLNGILRCAQHPGKGGKVAVLLIGFQALLAPATEGIVGQHHNGELFGDGCGVEVLPVQKLLLGVDFHPPAKIHIDFLPVGMAWVFQGFDCLCQNCVGRHQPHHRFCLGERQRVKYRPDGVAGKKGFPAAGGHLEAEIGNAGQYILIAAQRRRALLLPKEAEGGDIILGFAQQFQIAVQIGDDLPLIGFQFHVCRLLTTG